MKIELKSEAWIDPEMDLTSVSESLGFRKKKPLHIYHHTTKWPISQVPTVSSEDFVEAIYAAFGRPLSK